MKVVKVLLIFILIFGLSISSFSQNRQNDNKKTKVKSSVTLVYFRVVLAIEGETLTSLAERNGAFVEDVMNLNRGYYRTTKLKRGMPFRIPSKSEYKLVRAELNDTIAVLACRYNVSVDEILKLNPSQKSERRFDLIDRFGSPKKLTSKSLLVFRQKIKIPLEQTENCINQQPV